MGESGIIINSNSSRTNYIKFLIFYLQNEKYGIDVKNLKEIINLERVTPVSYANNVILGLINYRGKIVPVIDLSSYILGEATIIGPETRILICEIEDNDDLVLIGILIDDTDSVIDVSRESINRTSLSLKIPLEFIDGVIMLEDSSIIILNISAVLNIDKLAVTDISFEASANASFINEKSSDSKKLKKDNKLSAGEETGEKEDFLIFEVKGDLYGISMKDVQEVVKVNAVTQVPNTKPFMKGLIDLRGKAIPIVDMRLRCNFEERSYDHDTAVLILYFKNSLIGLVVDLVSDIIRISLKALSETLHYTADIERDFVSKTYNHEQGIIIILNIDKILTDQEFEDFKKKSEEGI